MLLLTEADRRPCVDMVRQLKASAPPPEMSHDALEFLIEGYARLVEGLLDPRASASGIEFAYSRLLGTRGGICRLCPAEDMGTPAAKSRPALGLGGDPPAGLFGPRAAARRSRHRRPPRRRRLGGQHGAVCSDADGAAARDGNTGQNRHLERALIRSACTWPSAKSSPCPSRWRFHLENTSAVKLRVRLLALFLTLHRCGFCAAFPAIQSLPRARSASTTRVAYPWWFVDCRLTERQLNWTHRRIPFEDLNWRF